MKIKENDILFTALMIFVVLFAVQSYHKEMLTVKNEILENTNESLKQENDYLSKQWIEQHISY